jgi:FlaA1/EpsC-like NDP-sugar epimerase
MLLARRKLLRGTLALCDAATLTASFVASYLIADIVFQRKFESFAGYAWLLALIGPAWLASLRVFGLYSSAVYASRRFLITRLVQAHVIASLLLMSSMYLTHSQAVSRVLLQVFLIISFLLLAAQKFALRAYLEHARRHAPVQRRKIVLVSTPEAAERYLNLVKAHTSMLADVIGIVTPTAPDAGLKKR